MSEDPITRLADALGSFHGALTQAGDGDRWWAKALPDAAAELLAASSGFSAWRASASAEEFAARRDEIEAIIPELLREEAKGGT